SGGFDSSFILFPSDVPLFRDAPLPGDVGLCRAGPQSGLPYSSWHSHSWLCGVRCPLERCRCRVGHPKLNTSKFTHRMASPMAAHFPAKPEFVQLTEWGTTRVPQGSSWMIFEVDSVAPSCAHPGAWVVHVRDYRYGAAPAGMLGGGYQIWSLTPGAYEPV